MLSLDLISPNQCLDILEVSSIIISVGFLINSRFSDNTKDPHQQKNYHLFEFLVALTHMYNFFLFSYHHLCFHLFKYVGNQKYRKYPVYYILRHCLQNVRIFVTRLKSFYVRDQSATKKKKKKYNKTECYQKKKVDKKVSFVHCSSVPRCRRRLSVYEDDDAPRRNQNKTEFEILFCLAHIISSLLTVSFRS